MEISIKFVDENITFNDPFEALLWTALIRKAAKNTGIAARSPQLIDDLSTFISDMADLYEDPYRALELHVDLCHTLEEMDNAMELTAEDWSSTRQVTSINELKTINFSVWVEAVAKLDEILNDIIDLPKQ